MENKQNTNETISQDKPANKPVRTKLTINDLTRSRGGLRVKTGIRAGEEITFK